MSNTNNYVVQGESGERFIPSSQRADGTWRKARKVKEGYVPQDEVPLYQSKGKQWAAGRSSYPVGLDPALIRAKEVEAAEKQKKQKEAKRVVETSHSVLNPVPKSVNKTQPPRDKQPPSVKNVELQNAKEVAKTQPKKKDKSENKDKVETTKQNGASTAVPVDPAKRLRNLKKKLKEIEMLEAKIKSKELKTPDKDQLEKVRRKGQLEDEILALELSETLNT